MLNIINLNYRHLKTTNTLLSGIRKPLVTDSRSCFGDLRESLCLFDLLPIDALTASGVGINSGKLAQLSFLLPANECPVTPEVTPCLSVL